MQTIIEKLKKLEEKDFFDNVNLHIHTCHSDGVLTPDKVLEKAIQAKLKIISITDHNSISAYEHIAYGPLENISVLSGVEFDCWHNTDFLHILGYGFDLDDKKIQSFCANSKKETEFDIIRFFNRRKAKQVIKAIKDAGGLAILAHPACCWNLGLKALIKELVKLGLDGMETYYPYVGHRGLVKFHTPNKIKKIAKDLNLVITGGTDCHSENIKWR